MALPNWYITILYCKFESAKEKFPCTFCHRGSEYLTKICVRRLVIRNPESS